MTQAFDTALDRFRSLLRSQGWPGNLNWVKVEDVVVFPMATTCINGRGQSNDLGAAHSRFNSARNRGVAIEIYGVGHLDDVTYAVVLPIEELVQGEEMFLEDNVKVSVTATPTRVVVARSRVRWWLIQARYRCRFRDAGVTFRLQRQHR